MKHALSLAALLLLGTSPARAATHCVGTVQELLSAMQTIAMNDAIGGAVDLRIRSGTYALPAPAEGLHALQFRIAFLSAHYRISGGWNAGCSVQSSQAVAATVLDGQGARGVLQILQGAVNNAPPAQPPVLQLQNLRFDNGLASSGALTRPGCLDYAVIPNSLDSLTFHPYRLLVENTVFQGCRIAMDVGAAIDVTVRNSLFIDNYGNPAAINAFYPRGPLFIINNTFRRNEVIGAGAEVRIGPGAAPAPSKYVTNNVFADPVNVGAPQLIGEGLTFVRRNRIEFVSGDSVYGFPFLVSNTAASPIFVGANDHRLASASPLRDQGQTAATGGVGTVDFAGAARVQGAAVDMGAYELGPAPVLPDALFGNGFE